MREIRVQDAVGLALAHDLTKIVPGKFKGARYKRGHVISGNDISELLDMGKEHIYILESKEEDIHEDEAAVQLANCLLGPNLRVSDPPREGKINIKARARGLFKVAVGPVLGVNSLGQVAISTLHNNTVVEEGTVAAATRAIPLVLPKRIMNQAREILSFGGDVLEIKPFRPLKVGLITTGSEIYYGRIKDKFTPVIKQKIAQYGGSIGKHYFTPDDSSLIKEKILTLKAMGLDLIILTGGMSVDPDDRTPGAVKASGAEVVAYGTPVLPGSMFLMAYLAGTPVVGLPGCAMYSKTTVFDLVLPRIFAEDRITREEIFSLGVGGLCRSCTQCTFPNCGFGKS